jgi:glycosyltransferase involved in cell wall biosynthesis
MSRELDHGGVERDVTNLATHLDRVCFKPYVGTYFPVGMRQKNLEAAGIEILHLSVTSLLSSSALKAAEKMRGFINAHQIRIVHCFDPIGVFALPIARLMRVPVVLGSQLNYRSIVDSKTRRLLRLTDIFADGMIVNCEAIRNHMIHEEGYRAERLRLCYNGVDIKEFYPLKLQRPSCLEGASLVIGTVCVLRSEKNLILLQKAFAKLLHIDSRIKLVIVGSGPELPVLQASARSLSIQGSCVFFPSTSSVANWMRAIDIFVLPSRSEAFPNALLESMACGCAVIGSDVGGIPELIGYDDRGLLFRNGDIDDLVRQLGRLVTNKELRSQLGEKASAYVKTHLNVEIAASNMGNIYKGFLSQTGIPFA